MSEKEISIIIESVIGKLQQADLIKKQQSYAEMFKEGLFRFVIPGVIVFIATFFALQRQFEIFRIVTEKRFEAVEKDIISNKTDIEKQEKSFEELAKEFYSKTRNGNNQDKKL